MLTLLNPDAFPWSQIDVRGLDLFRFAHGEATSVSTSWTSNGDSSDTTVTLALPAGFEIDTPTATVTVDGVPQTVQPTAVDDAARTITFAGPFSAFGATSTFAAQIVPVGVVAPTGTGTVVVASNGVNLAPSSFAVAAAPAVPGPLKLDTLYLQDAIDLQLDDARRLTSSYEFDLSSGFPTGSRFSVSVFDIDPTGDLDLSLFADVPGALPESDLTFAEQAEVAGRARFIGQARNIGQVQPLDVDTAGRARFIDADGAATSTQEAAPESREDPDHRVAIRPPRRHLVQSGQRSRVRRGDRQPGEEVPGSVAGYNAEPAGGVLLARAQAAPRRNRVRRTRARG